MTETQKMRFARRACAWPPRPPREEHVRLISEAELRSWIVHEDEDVVVLNKPGDVVCHPSKAGPWSSLVGAVREGLGLAQVHLVFRLDRETSGVVVIAKTPPVASRLQRAMQERRVGKVYWAILTGELREPRTVDQPLGDDLSSPVFIKTAVRADGAAARTHFEPIARAGAVAGQGEAGTAAEPVDANLGSAGQGRAVVAGSAGGASGAGPASGFTLARVVTETGRKHQIRAHAQWLGHSLVGDKIYGPDERCYLDFIDRGWNADLAAKLLMPRQALHCAEIDLLAAGLPQVFTAPLAEDMRDFAQSCGVPVPLTFTSRTG